MDAILLGIHIEQLRIQKPIKQRIDPIHLPEDQFVILFRLNKTLVRHLTNDLKPFLPIKKRKSALSPKVRVLVALRFYAQGSYQMSVAQDLTLAICQKSVSNCVLLVTEAIVANLAHQWIQFPSGIEIPLIRAQFYEKYNIHGVVGCIDCTHIYIASVTDDPIQREYTYVNRKNEHSINVQLICDASCRIINVNTKFPGSTHDSFIWKNSEIRNYIKEKYEEGSFNSWLIGDKGYPLEPFLMVPFHENVIQPNSKEEKYNIFWLNLKSTYF